MGKKAPTAEISINRYLDETNWHIETNDKATAERLRRLGWAPTEPTKRGPWWAFVVPLEVVTTRPRRTVERLKTYQRRVFGPPGAGCCAKPDVTSKTHGTPICRNCGAYWHDITKVEADDGE